jgi:hypothetical protein
MRYQNHFMHASERDASGHLTPEQRKSSLDFPIAVVNLLRKGTMDRDRSESKLYTAFCDLMAAFSRECNMNIINIGLDWHELSATHGGLAPVVQILWGATEKHMKSFGLSEGTFVATRDREPSDPCPDVTQDETPWGQDMVARRTRRRLYPTCMHHASLQSQPYACERMCLLRAGCFCFHGTLQRKPRISHYCCVVLQSLPVGEWEGGW